jgi:hypothetical protein
MRPPAHFRLEAVGHHASTFAQGVAGAPQIVSADAVEHGVDASTGKATNLLHEVHVLVVDGDTAQFPNHCGAITVAWRQQDPASAPTARRLDQFLMRYGKDLKSRHNNRLQPTALGAIMRRRG